MYIEIYLEYLENLIGICHIESAISYDDHDFNYNDGEDISREVVDYVAEETKLDKSLIHIMD